MAIRQECYSTSINIPAVSHPSRPAKVRITLEEVLPQGAVHPTNSKGNGTEPTQWNDRKPTSWKARYTTDNCLAAQLYTAFASDFEVSEPFWDHSGVSGSRMYRMLFSRRRRLTCKDRKTRTIFDICVISRTERHRKCEEMAIKREESKKTMAWNETMTWKGSIPLPLKIS